MSEQYEGSTFKGGQKSYWQADQENSDYILFVGANPLTATTARPTAPCA